MAICWITAESPFLPAVWMILLVAPIACVALVERALAMWVRQGPWSTLRPVLWLAASLSVLVWFDIPLRAKFFLSRPALEQAAREAPFSVPRRAGLFFVESATTSGDLVFLGSSKWGHNFVGVVRRPRGSAPVQGNAWHWVGFDSEWQYYSED